MVTKKTAAEKLAYTIKHLHNRMTADLEGRRDLILAEMETKPNMRGDEQAAVLRAINEILDARARAR